MIDFVPPCACDGDSAPLCLCVCLCVSRYYADNKNLDKETVAGALANAKLVGETLELVSSNYQNILRTGYRYDFGKGYRYGCGYGLVFQIPWSTQYTYVLFFFFKGTRKPHPVVVAPQTGRASISRRPD